jgi:hypothetical protein
MVTNPAEPTLLETRKKRQVIVAETLKLIGRAEEKHRNDKKRRRKWNRILIRLEDSLLEAKKAVAECDTLIEIARGRGDKPAEEPDQQPAPAEELSAKPTDADPEKRAAYAIVETPMEELADISLEHVALARAYMARDGYAAHDEEFKRALAAKLELASQLPRSQDSAREKAERRDQRLLREAVKKMQAGEIDAMSHDELDLLLNCYTILTNKLVPTSNTNRLLEIISRTIEPLRAERARRRLSSR